MMMSAVVRVKFIKSKVILRYHTKVVSNQVSSNSDNEIQSYSCSNSSTKMGKNEKQENIFWVTKRGNIKNRSRIREITNRDSFRDFTLSQKDYKSGQGFLIGTQRFQIEAEITNWGKRDFKSGQGLQIGAEQCVVCCSYLSIE